MQNPGLPTNNLVFHLAPLTGPDQIAKTYAYWKTNVHNRQASFSRCFLKNLFAELSAVHSVDEVLKSVAAYRFSKKHIRYLKTVPGLKECEEEFFIFLSELDSWTVEIECEDHFAFSILTFTGPLAVIELLKMTLPTLMENPSRSRIYMEAFRMIYATESQGEEKNVHGKVPNNLTLFGLRRAQGPGGGVSASNHCMLGGFDAAANVVAGQSTRTPVIGTHAHPYVPNDTDQKTLHEQQVLGGVSKSAVDQARIKPSNEIGQGLIPGKKRACGTLDQTHSTYDVLSPHCCNGEGGSPSKQSKHSHINQPNVVSNAATDPKTKSSHGILSVTTEQNCIYQRFVNICSGSDSSSSRAGNYSTSSYTDPGTSSDEDSVATSSTDTDDSSTSSGSGTDGSRSATTTAVGMAPSPFVRMLYDVFISYSHIGSKVKAKKLKEALENLGLRVWIDFEKLTLGKHLKDTALEGVENSQTFVSLAEPTYMDKVAGKINGSGNMCKAEFEYAVKQRGFENMVAVVTDEDLKDTRTWRGPLHSLGERIYCSYTSDDELDDCARSIAEFVRNSR